MVPSFGLVSCAQMVLADAPHGYRPTRSPVEAISFGVVPTQKLLLLPYGSYWISKASSSP